MRSLPFPKADRLPLEPKSCNAKACTLSITVATGATLALRRVITLVCGDRFDFFSLATHDHGRRAEMTVRLSRELAVALVDAIMCALPAAEIGRIAGARPSAQGSTR